MKTSTRLPSLLALSLMMLLPANVLADSVEYTETRRTVTDGGGTSTTTTTNTTNVVPIGQITGDVYISTLEGRRLQLESAIAAGQASGTISEAQAREWRAQLDQIARQQAAGKDSTFTYVSAVPLAMSLDRLGSVVTSVVPSAVFTPLISSNRFVFVDGRIVMLDDVMVRRAELESRIAWDQARGKLSARKAANLRMQMTKIARVEEQMRSRNPALNVKQSRTLYRMFDRIGSMLDHA